MDGCPLEMTGVTRRHIIDLLGLSDMATALAARTIID